MSLVVALVLVSSPLLVLQELVATGPFPCPVVPPGMGRRKGDPGLAVWSGCRAGTGRGAGAGLLPPALAGVPLRAAGADSPARQRKQPHGHRDREGRAGGQGAQGHCVGAHSPVSGGEHGQGCRAYRRPAMPLPSSRRPTAPLPATGS